MTYKIILAAIPITIFFVVFAGSYFVSKRKRKLLIKYYNANAVRLKAKILWYNKNTALIRRPPEPTYKIIVEFTTNDGFSHEGLIKTDNDILANADSGDEIYIYCIQQYYTNHYNILLLPVRAELRELLSVREIKEYIGKVKTRGAYKREMINLLELRKWKISGFFVPLAIAGDVEQL